MKQNSTLKELLNRYKNNKSIAQLNAKLCTIDASEENQKLIELYNKSIPLIENLIWQGEINDNTINSYQHLFHELEKLIDKSNSPDTRHKFIITIPVADRPQHLNACLNSILTLCTQYRYGGLQDGVYTKINILITDDSQHLENINKNKEISKTFTNKGLKVIYFGQDQQRDIIAQLDNIKTQNITGNIDTEKFYHKGASITRNITYLKLQQLQENETQATLFYFIDSDQEFQVSIQELGEYKERYVVNYFYYLDRIFSDNKTSILTGKVVGDPPVSPSVMAGTFLEDLIYFIKRMDKLKPQLNCSFHNNIEDKDNDASYHDMAELFGFKPSLNTHDYHCTLKGTHNHIDCFNNIASKLKHFFDGEHPTRKSYYQHEDVLRNLKPARTIYTGNYIFKPENLKYFIPFANLKLRMAGPVLGRLIKAELGDAFVSANLPMLHKRTVDTIGQSEFRPGVNRKNEIVDLSGEFTRQFFGDVMLFSMIELTEMGYPKENIAAEALSKTINSNIALMQNKYMSKHSELLLKTRTLKSLFNSPENWWFNKPELTPARLNFEQFINNIEFNFGKDAKIYKIINSAETIDSYKNIITDAITSYSTDMITWQAILFEGTTQQ